MAKLVLNDIDSLANTASAKQALNENFTDIEAAIENTLSRDGTTPNQMQADIDMDSNDLLNVNRIDAVEFYKNGVPFEQTVAYANKLYDLFSGTGAQTDFVMQTDPGSLGNLYVSVDGVDLKPGIDYNYDGTTITFVVAPAAGTNNIYIRYDVALATEDSVLRQDLRSIISGKGAQLVTYVPRGTGAVPRSQYDVNRARIDVLDFFSETERELVYAGTLADFSTSIQKAIDYAETFAGTGGATVHFPAGKYGYTSLTIEANNVVLKADGEVYLLKMATTGNGLVVGNLVGRLFGVDIRGFQLGSSVTGVSGNLISFINTGQCGVYDLTQTAAFGVPFIGLRVTNSSQFFYANQQWQDCGADGCVFEDMVDLYMSNARSDSHTLSGYVFNNVAGVYASNVSGYDNGVHAFSALNTYGSPVLTTQNQHWFMANCIGDTSGNHNWNITQLSQARFTACWGATHRVATVDLHGIALANCVDVELNNCTATNNNGSGVFILSSCTHIRITGGGYHGNGVVAGSTHKVGLYSDNAQVTFTGLTATDDLRAALALPRVQTHGIRLTGAANGVLIDNCNLKGNLTAALDVPTTANGLSIRNSYDGDAGSYASASVVTVSPLAETVEITGTTDVLDIHPRWKGRKLKIGFTSTARLMDKAGGAAFALPTPAVQPGAFGTAAIFFNGTNWLLESFSVNDGV